jgi:hypothetical protein
LPKTFLPVVAGGSRSSKFDETTVFVRQPDGFVARVVAGVKNQIDFPVAVDIAGRFERVNSVTAARFGRAVIVFEKGFYNSSAARRQIEREPVLNVAFVRRLTFFGRNLINPRRERVRSTVAVDSDRRRIVKPAPVFVRNFLREINRRAR